MISPLPRRTRSLFDVDLVAQLVHVVGAARKAAREMFGDAFDLLDDALGQLVRAKALRQRRGAVGPEACGNPFIDSTVAQDDELPLLGRDEEEDSVAMNGLRHADALEGPLGDAPQLAAGRTRLDVHADLAGRPLLGGTDRASDARLVERFDEFFLSHHQPPLAPPPPKLPPPPENP